MDFIVGGTFDTRRFTVELLLHSDLKWGCCQTEEVGVKVQDVGSAEPTALESALTRPKTICTFDIGEKRVSEGSGPAGEESHLILFIYFFCKAEDEEQAQAMWVDGVAGLREWVNQWYNEGQSNVMPF